jgi:ribonuclease R
MLPRQLSSGICSLNPGVDRCAMVVRLDLDEEAAVVGRSFAAAVIRSHARLNYPDVAAALMGDFRGRVASYRKWETELHVMDRLARIMRKRRASRGALELEIPEAKVVLDEDNPLLVRDVVRSKGVESVRRAYELVEEYMLAANEAVGTFFHERELPTVWRIHPPPDESRIAELAEVVEAFGIHMDVGEATSPAGMKRVLEQIRGTKAERALTFLALRSLTQATYSTENLGHFGLASWRYLHFTSPIRRYPDVLVHRLLKHQLHREGQASGGGKRLRPPSVQVLEELASASSGYERRAAEAEREVVDMYRTFVMRDELGEVFAGAVSAVTNFGVFVELDEPFVEGLIKLESLGDDYWEHDPRAMRVVGRKTRRALGLGDRVKVEVINVSVARRQVDLRLVEGLGGGDSHDQPQRRTRKGKQERRERAQRHPERGRRKRR